MNQCQIALLVWISVLPFISCTRMTDRIVDSRDGTVYKVIKIGDQLWMADNLSVTKFNDGEAIPLIIDPEEWVEATTPAFSWYDNDKSSYRDMHSALYNWYAVETDRLCPTGWHVPSDDEWKELEGTLGLDSSAVHQRGIRGNAVGGQLKTDGLDYWQSPNVGATNTSGFKGMPVGHRNWQSGGFVDLGLFGTWWSRTEEDASQAWRRTLHFNDDKIRRFTSHKRDGFSVRCVSDKDVN